MSEKLVSSSPIDGQEVWSGPPARAADVEVAMDRAVIADREWRATPLEKRIAIVQRYGQFLQENRQRAVELISREVGKLKWDAEGEVAASIAKVDVTIKALQERRSTQLVAESSDAGPDGQASISIRRRIRHLPLGPVLILGPFNFPLHLPGGQVIPALLAGNAVVFKPSDQATAVGQFMMEGWTSAGLPTHVVQMIPGDVETAKLAIDSPAVKAVFLTGGREAGRAIHRQLAGRYDVLLALELGGNNPIAVLPDAEAQRVGEIVSFSAFVSSGQRCTCARRVIVVESENANSQVDAILDSTRSLRTGMPGDNPAPHLGPLVSERAAQGVLKTFGKLCEIGCQPLIEPEVEADHPTLMRPAILDATGLNEQQRRQLGDLEWFGPILVIQRASDARQAVAMGAETPYGLSASLLGGTQDDFDHFVESIGAGVVNWNTATTGAAGTMPFGGLGDSGNHRPAGYYAIDFCSDPVASIERDSLWQRDPWAVTQ